MTATSAVTVNAIVFFISDLDRTQTFYSDVLGLALQRIGGHDGEFLTGEAGSLTLVFIPGEETASRSPVIVFGLDGGIDDAVEALARQNVEIVLPVSEAPDGGLAADFLDPDGHVLSYYQAADAPRSKA